MSGLELCKPVILCRIVRGGMEKADEAVSGLNQNLQKEKTEEAGKERNSSCIYSVGRQ